LKTTADRATLLKTVNWQVTVYHIFGNFVFHSRPLLEKKNIKMPVRINFQWSSILTPKNVIHILIYIFCETWKCSLKFVHNFSFIYNFYFSSERFFSGWKIKEKTNHAFHSFEWILKKEDNVYFSICLFNVKDFIKNICYKTIL
jgi:hypothetical protein